MQTMDNGHHARGFRELLSERKGFTRFNIKTVNYGGNVTVRGMVQQVVKSGSGPC